MWQTNMNNFDRIKEELEKEYFETDSKTKYSVKTPDNEIYHKLFREIAEPRNINIMKCMAEIGRPPIEGITKPLTKFCEDNNDIEMSKRSRDNKIANNMIRFIMKKIGYAPILDCRGREETARLRKYSQTKIFSERRVGVLYGKIGNPEIRVGSTLVEVNTGKEVKA